MPEAGRSGVHRIESTSPADEAPPRSRRLQLAVIRSLLDELGSTVAPDQASARIVSQLHDELDRLADLFVLPTPRGR